MGGVEPSPVGTELRRSRGAADIPAAWYRVPPRRPTTIPRHHLVKRLLDADAPIVAVTAPAGYGKSLAVLGWEAIDERPFAWAQLTDADNDAVHLGRHLALAVDAVEPITGHNAAIVVGSGRSPDLDIFPALAREIADRSPMVLVLDDVHLLHAADARRGIEALLAAIPADSCIALIGRHLPFHLGRHRVAGRIHAVAADELAMTALEAGQMFARAGLSLDDDDAADLVERTEGWPGGLHLAALAVSQGQTLVAFSGRDRLVAEYLAEEVFESTDPDVLEFLERSSTVEPMGADLLDRLLERTDSARMLATIEASGNLFLVPLDRERHAYRYHHLFRDKLSVRLWRNEPVLAKRLESRASVLAEDAGDTEGAIRHAVAAGEHQRAANLVLRATMPRWFDGRHAQLGSWLALLGEDALDRYPAAAIATAWSGLADLDPERIARACAAAERFGDTGPLADDSPSLAVALAAVRMVVAARGVSGVIEDAQVVLDADGPARNPWWALACGAQGTAYAMLGDSDMARRRLEECLAWADRSPYLQAACLAHLAVLSLHEGELAEADGLANRALRIVDTHHLEAFAPAASVYAACALVAARHRRPHDARRAAGTARTIVVRFGQLAPRTVLFILVLLARTAMILGDRADARLLVREAQRARRRDPSATFLNQQLDELAQQLSSAGDLSTAQYQPLSTAELRVLEYLPTHLSLKEISAELLISRNTAKTHSVAIYRKLGVSSRTVAVAAARHLGLLPS